MMNDIDHLKNKEIKRNGIYFSKLSYIDIKHSRHLAM